MNFIVSMYAMYVSHIKFLALPKLYFWLNVQNEENPKNISIIEIKYVQSTQGIIRRVHVMVNFDKNQDL